MPREISLSQGNIAIVDDEDYELVSRIRWYCSKDGYAYGFKTFRKPDGTSYRLRLSLHRFILNAPRELDVDHINGDRLDNRRCNLRFATRSQNCANSGPRAGSSAFKGVSWLKSRNTWRASIRMAGHYVTLGQFHDEVEAARAYDQAALATWGSFAYLNFPQAV